jgi:hypothetical protein
MAVFQYESLYTLVWSLLSAHHINPLPTMNSSTAESRVDARLGSVWINLCTPIHVQSISQLCWYDKFDLQSFRNIPGPAFSPDPDAEQNLDAVASRHVGPHSQTLESIS